MDKSEAAAERCAVPQVLASQKARVQQVWDGASGSACTRFQVLTSSKKVH